MTNKQIRSKAEAVFGKDCWINVQLIDEKVYVTNLVTKQKLIFSLKKEQ